MGVALRKAMRDFARWASARPLRVALLALLFMLTPLSPAAGGLLVIDALRRGGPAALTSAMLALAGLTLVGVLAGAAPVVLLSLAAPTLLAGVAGGWMLKWSRSLSMAFQGTVLGGIVCAAAFMMIAPEPDAVGELMRSAWVGLLEDMGVSATQLQPLTTVDPLQYLMTFLVAILGGVIVSLLLGFWWYTLIEGGVSFAQEFRRLKLGRVAGAVLLLLITADLVVTADFVQAMAPLAVIGFLFQGLAVMHARSHSDKWPRVAIVAVYVFMFSPLAPVVVLGLSGIGLFDNFFALRARHVPRD